MFTTNAINNFTLYPRQTINIDICVNIDPACAGTNVDFDNIFNVTSNKGSDTNSLLVRDFHTTEANVTGALYIANSSPDINSDATYEYTNRIIITNDGGNTANDVNFNMGLTPFTNLGVIFDQIAINQISGPTVSINNNFDGSTTNSLILNPGNSLAPGRTVILEIDFITNPISSRGSASFRQMNYSQTQGGADGTNESVNPSAFTFVSWSDGLGNHVDRYYEAGGPTSSVSSTLQCDVQIQI